MARTIESPGVQISEVERSFVHADDRYIWTYEGRSVLNGRPLPFTMKPKDLKPLVQEFRNRIMKLSYIVKDAPPPEKLRKAKDLNLEEMFEYLSAPYLMFGIAKLLFP